MGLEIIEYGGNMKSTLFEAQQPVHEIGKSGSPLVVHFNIISRVHIIQAE